MTRAAFWLLFGWIWWVGGLGCAAKAAPQVTPVDDGEPKVWLWIDPYEVMLQRYAAVCWQMSPTSPTMRCFAMGTLLDALNEFGDVHPGFHPGDLMEEVHDRDVE